MGVRFIQGRPPFKFSGGKNPAWDRALESVPWNRIPVPIHAEDQKSWFRSTAQMVYQSALQERAPLFGKLTFQMGEGRLSQTAALVISQKQLRIGRDPQRSHLCFFRDQHVSGLHVELYRGENGELFLMDQNSTNGTNFGTDRDGQRPLYPYLGVRVPEGVSYLSLATRGSSDSVTLKLTYQSGDLRISTQFPPEVTWRGWRRAIDIAVDFCFRWLLGDQTIRRPNRFFKDKKDPDFLTIRHEP